MKGSAATGNRREGKLQKPARGERWRRKGRAAYHTSRRRKLKGRKKKGLEEEGRGGLPDTEKKGIIKKSVGNEKECPEKKVADDRQKKMESYGGKREAGREREREKLNMCVGNQGKICRPHIRRKEGN